MNHERNNDVEVVLRQPMESIEVFTARLAEIMKGTGFFLDDEVGTPSVELNVKQTQRQSKIGRFVRRIFPS